MIFGGVSINVPVVHPGDDEVSNNRSSEGGAKLGRENYSHIVVIKDAPSVQHQHIRVYHPSPYFNLTGEALRSDEKAESNNLMLTSSSVTHNHCTFVTNSYPEFPTQLQGHGYRSQPNARPDVVVGPANRGSASGLLTFTVQLGRESKDTLFVFSGSKSQELIHCIRGATDKLTEMGNKYRKLCYKESTHLL